MVMVGRLLMKKGCLLYLVHCRGEEACLLKIGTLRNEKLKKRVRGRKITESTEINQYYDYILE